MKDQEKITDRQIAGIVGDNRTSSGVSGSSHKPGFCFAADLRKSPQIDRDIENTLVNDIVISELLTKREVQILRSILAGKTNKQIALMLSRSRRTIEYHRNRLMRKLNVHNTVELVMRATEMRFT